MNDVCGVEVAGETLSLLPEAAAVWAAQSTLFLADLHLGKDDVFRRAGLAVPSGVVASDLARLTRLIEAHAVRRVVLLGDFVHAQPASTAEFVAEFCRWREHHRAVEMIVVAGNHDRRLAGHELSRQVQWCEREWSEGPFVARHHPGASDRGYVLCGHLHPVMKLMSRRERMRLPAFWVRQNYAVLPSFGSFTGGAEIAPEAGDRVYVIGGDVVAPVPAVR